MQFNALDLFENLQQLSASKVLSEAANSPNMGGNALREAYQPFMQSDMAAGMKETPAYTQQFKM